MAPFGYWIDRRLKFDKFSFLLSHFSIIVTNTTHLHDKRLWTWAHYFKLSSRHVHFHRCSTILAYNNREWVCNGNRKHHSGWCCQRRHWDWDKSSGKVFELADWAECEYPFLTFYKKSSIIDYKRDRMFKQKLLHPASMGPHQKSIS